MTDSEEQTIVALARLDAKMEHISEMLEFRLGRLEGDLARTADKADRLHSRIDEEIKVASDTHEHLRDNILDEVEKNTDRIEALELSRAKLIGMLVGASSLGGLFTGLVLLAVDMVLKGGA